MFALLIHALEAFVVSLFGLIAFRCLSLNKAAENQIEQVDQQVRNIVRQTAVKPARKKSTPVLTYQDKMESLKMAQVFAGAQMVEIKRVFADLESDHLEWLREAIGLYLIGAVDLIGKKTHCDVKSRKDLIQLVLRSSLKLDHQDAAEYFREALHRQPQSDNDYMVRAGARAAKMWLQNKRVPTEHSLRTQLDEWGVFA